MNYKIYEIELSTGSIISTKLSTSDYEDLYRKLMYSPKMLDILDINNMGWLIFPQHIVSISTYSEI